MIIFQKIMLLSMILLSSHTFASNITSWKSNYSTGADVWLEVEDKPGNVEDWVGIYPVGSSNNWNNVIDWRWARNTSVTEVDPGDWYKFNLEDGEYEARFFLNNSYTVEDSIAFTVGKKFPETTKLTQRATDDFVLRPTVGNPSNDPIYGTQIKMVHKADGYIASYPKVQSWNKDMTLIRIGNRLYNAHTLEESQITKGITNPYSKLCSRNSDYFRWSTQDAKKFYVLDSHLRFVEGHIAGNNITCNTDNPLFDFKQHNYDWADLGPGEGNIDFNDKYITFAVKKKGDNSMYIMLFDIHTPKDIWVKPFNEGTHWKKHINRFGIPYWTPEILDWVSVSPSGKYILINATTGMYRYDINLDNLFNLKYKGKDGNTKKVLGEHGDIGFNINGNEVFVQNVSGDGVYSFNLDNEELGKELLTSPYSGGHISCRNVEHKGWCYITREEKGYRQVFALKLDGTSNETVQNFSQTHKNNGYWETYGGVSPDGTKMIFNSHWGTNTIDTFIAETK